jgi:hypothetical protein
MTDVYPVPTRGGLFPSKAERQFGKSLDQLQVGAALDVAHVRAAEAVECAKIEAIGSVSAIALMEVSHLSMAEAVLIDRTPHAAGRLRHVADTGTIAMAEVVGRMSRGLR